MISSLFVKDYILQIILLLSFHFVASLLISTAVWFLFPLRYKKPAFLSPLLIFLLAFSVPVIGYLFILLLSIILRRQKDIEPIKAKIMETFNIADEKINVPRRRFGEGAVIEFVKDKTLPTHIRLKILPLLTEIDLPKGTALIKTGLKDPEQDIRLLSFSLISRRERELNKEIYIRLKKLESEDNEKNKGFLHKELSYLYWEYLYTGIADEDHKKILMEEVEFHALEALKILENVPELYFNLGRLYLLKKDLNMAYEYLKRAYDLRIQEVKIAPYLAEIYYLNGDYEKVRGILRKHPSLKYHPVFYPVMILWESNIYGDLYKGI